MSIDTTGSLLWDGIFFWYVVSAMITVTILIVWLKKLGYLEFVTESTVHDIGKWMFAISFLWTYIYIFSIHVNLYVDIPEEVILLPNSVGNLIRHNVDGNICKLCFPMIMLMSRDSKPNLFFNVCWSNYFYWSLFRHHHGSYARNSWSSLDRILSWMELELSLFFFRDYLCMLC